MTHPEDHSIDKAYWDDHWQPEEDGDGAPPPVHPYLAEELNELNTGTALDAGCGAGAEAIWLAQHGWQVTGADIAEQALQRAAVAADAAGVADRISWVHVDLEQWEPTTTFDLVTTHYAHPTIGQLEFYDRIADWVAPGGTLLIVGHLHHHDHGTADQHADGHGHGHGHGEQAESEEWAPPESATVTPAQITARFDPAAWELHSAREAHRTVPRPDGERRLDDVIVRLSRRA
ncbi:class I SAM-dependent methyltransferase [Nocardioides sp. Bht2]|uniref:class I SAM-dependent methyltransferase n=1 Tax=Nocardioides sp. Bht2 TaxID=3392297 RepID=UPI0039B579EE